jgi:hypothetical protein
MAYQNHIQFHHLFSTLSFENELQREKITRDSFPLWFRLMQCINFIDIHIHMHRMRNRDFLARHIITHSMYAPFTDGALCRQKRN